MRRKHWVLSLGMLILVGGTTTGVVLFLLRHEPRLYRELAIAPGPEREQASGICQSRIIDLMNAITNDDPTWSATFTQDQLNSYFQEDFVRSGGLDSLREAGIRDPRISIEPEQVRLAFRYGNGFWETVISIDVRMWLTAQEPNVVAMELLALRGGSLPIPSRSLLDYISEAAHQLNIEVTWYRHNGHPVALMQFQADQVRPTVQLQRLQIQSGRIFLAGRSLTSAGSSLVD